MTYVEVLNYLLKSYAIDSNNAKARAEIAALRKAANETSV